MNQQIIGVGLFVGVILLIQWIPGLTPARDPWRVATEAVKQTTYHWAVVPLAILAVAGAVFAVFQRTSTSTSFSSRHVAGVAVFAGAMVVLRLNPGLFETTFNPDWEGSAWRTSYHWTLIPLIAVGIGGAAIAAIPECSTRRAIHLLNRRALGVLVFTGAFFVLRSIPGLIHRRGQAIDGTWQQSVSYHWGIVPIVFLAVAGAALAVVPSCKAEATFERTKPSRFALGAAWVLAGYPLALVIWFYLYVLRQRVVLGYWPRPYHPDPKDAGMNFHHDSMPFMFELVPIVALGAISLIVALRNCDPNYRWRRPQALWVVALGILIALVKFDPGYFIEWWAD